MVSTKIKGHLLNLVKTAGLPENTDSLEMLVTAFVDKLTCYAKQVSKYDLIDVKNFKDNESSAALIITYSGSLLSIGPKVNNERKVEYISIGLRKDVPEIAMEECSVLKGDFSVDSIVEFIKGPIKSSSAIYKIAKTNESLNVLAQEEVLRDITRILVDDFVEVNNTIIV